jgi:predicted CopG family antitoxin
MNTKLTLTIEKDVIEKAKAFAKEKSRSLSDIIENYLKIVTSRNKKPINDITPLVKSLKGSFRAPASYDYSAELEKALSDKYRR